MFRKIFKIYLLIHSKLVDGESKKTNTDGGIIDSVVDIQTEKKLAWSLTMRNRKFFFQKFVQIIFNGLFALNFFKYSIFKCLKWNLLSIILFLKDHISRSLLNKSSKGKVNYLNTWIYRSAWNPCEARPPFRVVADVCSSEMLPRRSVLMTGAQEHLRWSKFSAGQHTLTLKMGVFEESDYKQLGLSQGNKWRFQNKIHLCIWRIWMDAVKYTEFDN